MNRKRQKGFTIVEILVVVIIIGLLASFTVPKVFKNMGKTKRSIAKSKMSIIASELASFNLHCDRMPTDEEGLDALINAPEDLADKWQGRYLKPSQLLDPWGNEYIYVEEGEINPGSYDLISFGADGEEGGEEGSDDEDIYND